MQRKKIYKEVTSRDGKPSRQAEKDDKEITMRSASRHAEKEDKEVTSRDGKPRFELETDKDFEERKKKEADKTGRSENPMEKHLSKRTLTHIMLDLNPCRGEYLTQDSIQESIQDSIQGLFQDLCQGFMAAQDFIQDNQGSTDIAEAFKIPTTSQDMTITPAIRYNRRRQERAKCKD